MNGQRDSSRELVAIGSLVAAGAARYFGEPASAGRTVTELKSNDWPDPIGYRETVTDAGGNIHEKWYFDRELTQPMGVEITGTKTDTGMDLVAETPAGDLEISVTGNDDGSGTVQVSSDMSGAAGNLSGEFRPPSDNTQVFTYEYSDQNSEYQGEISVDLETGETQHSSFHDEIINEINDLIDQNSGDGGDDDGEGGDEGGEGSDDGSGDNGGGEQDEDAGESEDAGEGGEEGGYFGEGGGGEGGEESGDADEGGQEGEEGDESGDEDFGPHHDDI